MFIIRNCNTKEYKKKCSSGPESSGDTLYVCVDSENRAQVDGNSYKKGLLLFFEKVFKFIRTTKKLKCT